ncbi:AGRN [Bugula neritina]|uniref:AGRN n=1 Tax=Bugula neritina TaxID=10212 RepID=A0A7J7JG22_BUGNE|nr:AGRN [Bugula neritina]
MSHLILLKVLPCLLASVIINLADSSMLPTYYGRKCSSTQTLQEREDLADVVFSGRVQAIHRNKFNSSYHCDIRIFRVIKGEDIIADLLNLPASLESLYTQTIVLSGFGTDEFCDTQVQHGDTRIFLAAYSYFGYPSKLSLSSSPIRIGVRTLHRSAIVHGDTGELCL